MPQREIPLLVRLWQAGRLPLERLEAGTLPLERLNEALNALDALADGGVVRQIVVP